MAGEKRGELFAFDLDGTLLKSNISILFYKYAVKKLSIPWTSLFSCFFLYCNYKIFFNLPSFHHKVFEKIFFNRSLTHLSELANGFIKGHDWKKEIYRPAYEKLKYAQDKKAYTAIFSSSPDFLVKRISHLLGVNFFVASSYVCNEEGKCKRILNLVDGSFKRKNLKKLSNRLKVKKVHAFSDSIVDIDFLDISSYPCVVNPDRLLKKVALSRKWNII